MENWYSESEGMLTVQFEHFLHVRAKFFLRICSILRISGRLVNLKMEEGGKIQNTRTFNTIVGQEQWAGGEERSREKVV